MAPSESREWHLAKKPLNLPVFSGPDATFRQVTRPLPELQDGQILVKVLYLSNDPAQRGWMGANVDPARLYVPPIDVNTKVRSYSVSEVVESKSPHYTPGTVVRATAGWCDYAILNAAECQPLKPLPNGLPFHHYLASFGGPGLTAVYGLIDIVHTTADDTVVVSGAAGATGSIVVQLAKNVLGCRRVVGIAGSDAKCRWVESLGADVCVNYKSASFRDDLIAATDGLVSVYFDCVGGDITDLMITRMQREGRIAACGAISHYNQAEIKGITNWNDIFTMRLLIKGFIVLDAGVKRTIEMAGFLRNAYAEGKIKVSDDGATVVPTKFEDIPKTWMMLFDGGNTGKLITQLELPSGAGGEKL